MIIAKLTSSCRTYVIVKQKKTNQNTNKLIQLRHEHAYTEDTYL